MVFTHTTIVHITWKAKGLGCQILKTLCIAQESENHTLPLPDLARISDYKLVSQINFSPVSVTLAGRALGRFQFAGQLFTNSYSLFFESKLKLGVQVCWEI